MASKAPKPAHSVGCTREQFALMCWLRMHPAVAATYGIKACNGATTMGSMLLQTLWAQGMDVTWHERLPKGTPAADAKPNEKGAAWIKAVSRRPGAHMKPLEQRPSVAPPDKAAICRHNHGRLPRRCFPQLAKLAKKRKRQFTCTGNPICGPGAATALVDRSRFVHFVQSKLRCDCGARLRFSSAASSQVGVCARLSRGGERSPRAGWTV